MSLGLVRWPTGACFLPHQKNGSPPSCRECSLLTPQLLQALLAQTPHLARPTLPPGPRASTPHVSHTTLQQTCHLVSDTSCQSRPSPFERLEAPSWAPLPPGSSLVQLLLR